MPLKRRGSVSARLTVWFSATRRAANASRVAAITSMPPASSAASAARPATTCSEARRCLPASVRASVPTSNSKKASALRRRLLARREPAQPAGDHQVDDDEELALEGQDDALAEPLDADRRAGPRPRRRRRHRAQQERMADADALEAMADDLGRQPLDVDADVGQLGHRASVPAAAAGRARGVARRRPRSRAGSPPRARASRRSRPAPRSSPAPPP